jgi:hypothetical protein
LHATLDPITTRTHVAIWKWVQKYYVLADRVVVGKRMNQIYEYAWCSICQEKEPSLFVISFSYR